LFKSVGSRLNDSHPGCGVGEKCGDGVGGGLESNLSLLFIKQMTMWNQVLNYYYFLKQMKGRNHMLGGYFVPCLSSLTCLSVNSFPRKSCAMNKTSSENIRKDCQISENRKMWKKFARWSYSLK